MLLRVYSNRFLRNHTGKVIPRVLPSCWKLSRFQPNPTWCISCRGLKTIQGNFQTAASDSYFWKKRNDWMSYKTTTTNLNRNHMAYPTLFHAVGTQCLVAVFLPLVCFLPVFFQGTVNSMRRTLFFESDHATMSGRFSVWTMWTGNCRDVLRSAETFQFHKYMKYNYIALHHIKRRLSEVLGPMENLLKLVYWIMKGLFRYFLHCLFLSG